MAEWTPALSVGVTEIDKQHQELFARVNGLIEACNAGKGKEAVAEVLDFLGKYVVTHFQTEEKLMKKYDYPDYEQHKTIHDDFIKDVQALQARFSKEGAGIHIIVQTNTKLVEWLNRHITRMDKKFGEFLQSKL